uniref:Actin cytoskeleton-regulatory complex protein PAN1-like n=1 Tax=Macrostomum lignano TaxID=282301 RepID=A0A1I8FJE9_9PLAT
TMGEDEEVSEIIEELPPAENNEAEYDDDSELIRFVRANESPSQLDENEAEAEDCMMKTQFRIASASASVPQSARSENLAARRRQWTSVWASRLLIWRRTRQLPPQPQPPVQQFDPAKVAEARVSWWNESNSVDETGCFRWRRLRLVE